MVLPTKPKRKRKRKAAQARPAPDVSAGEAAAEYLEQWKCRESVGTAWKFSKKRQTFLLRAWPDRSKLSGDAFKKLLPYLQELHENARARTLAQARGVVEQCEAAEKAAAADAGVDGEEAGDDADLTPEEAAEERALRKIRHARALRVVAALI